MSRLRVAVFTGVLLWCSMAFAGADLDYFDRPLAAPVSGQELAPVPTGLTTQALQAPISPVWSLVFSSGYSKKASGKGLAGVSYSLTPNKGITLEPSIAFGTSGLGAMTTTEELDIDVTIAPRVTHWTHLEIALDPEVDIDDGGHPTYIPAIRAKSTWGDYDSVKYVFSFAAGTPCTSSDCGYSTVLGVGAGHRLGKMIGSVTVKPKVSAPSFSMGRAVALSAELGAAYPLQSGRSFQLVIIPAMSDVSDVGGTWSFGAKLVASL